MRALVTLVFAFRRWMLKIPPSVLSVIEMPGSESLNAERSILLGAEITYTVSKEPLKPYKTYKLSFLPIVVALCLM